jgi:hypothetical protein
MQRECLVDRADVRLGLLDLLHIGASDRIHTAHFLFDCCVLPSVKRIIALFQMPWQEGTTQQPT